MKKLDLVIYEGQVHRVLSIKNDKCFVINCIKISMPFWVEMSCLEEKENLVLETITIDVLSPANKKIAYERYSLIAPILPFVEDDYMRAHIISRISEEKGISKQTIRKYLCVFLVYQDIGSLAPQETQVKPLTQDEKDFRWALNKFYYSSLKHTLKGSYLLLLKEKYTNEDGCLKDEYPPFHRFRYFYKKTSNPQTKYISRDGLSAYQRNNRPLVGGGVLEFTNSIGIGMLDSSILDIYLVNDANELIGRPILTACVDAYSGLCCGYALTWEGGLFSIRKLLHNIICDKVGLCKSFGITISQDDWNCDKLPYTFLTDKGKEYTSYALEQLTELGVNIVNLPPYRPDLKSCVEQFFNVIQNSYKPYLKSKGVIEDDFQERGTVDYRKTACLTLKQFETILLKCILYYDNNLSSPINSNKTLFTVTFKVKSVAAGTNIKISYTGVKASDGSADANVSTVTYSTTIAAPLATDNNLASLTVSNATISPAFSAGTTSYTASVPFDVSKLNVSATAKDSKAKVSVNSPTLTPGGKTNVTVIVTAENGSKKTYTIVVTRASDPNYVASGNNKLSGISVEGFLLSPQFSADKTNYIVWAPYETENVTVNGSAQDSKASVAVEGGSNLVAGQDNEVKVICTAENGDKKTYTVVVKRAPAHDGSVDNTPDTDNTPSEPNDSNISTPDDTNNNPSNDVSNNNAPNNTGIELWLVIVVGVGALVIGAVIGFVVKGAMTKKN